MKYWSRTAGIVLLSAAAGCGSKGESALVMLDQPAATVGTTFQQVSNVVELADGRLALTDVKARKFYFVNPASGELQSIGEHADTIWPLDSFPDRHKIPGFVLRLRGDTLGLVGFRLRAHHALERSRRRARRDQSGTGGRAQPAPQL